MVTLSWEEVLWLMRDTTYSKVQFEGTYLDNQIIKTRRFIGEIERLEIVPPKQYYTETKLCDWKSSDLIIKIKLSDLTVTYPTLNKICRSKDPYLILSEHHPLQTLEATRSIWGRLTFQYRGIENRSSYQLII